MSRPILCQQCGNEFFKGTKTHDKMGRPKIRCPYCGWLNPIPRHKRKK